jgi:hypothetical protein
MRLFEQPFFDQPWAFSGDFGRFRIGAGAREAGPVRILP